MSLNDKCITAFVVLKGLIVVRYQNSIPLKEGQIDKVLFYFRMHFLTVFFHFLAKIKRACLAI